MEQLDCYSPLTEPSLAVLPDVFTGLTYNFFSGVQLSLFKSG